MLRNIMLIPIDTNIGLDNVSIGLAYAIKCKNIKLSIFKPITNSCNDNNLSKKIINFLDKNLNIPFINLFKMSYVESLIISKQKDRLMEEIFNKYNEQAKNIELTLIEGLVHNKNYKLTNINNFINYEIAKILNAKIIFVSNMKEKSLENFNKKIKILLNDFSSSKNTDIIGIIINKLNYNINTINFYPIQISKIFNYLSDSVNIIFPKNNSNFELPIIGYIPRNRDLFNIRVIDIYYQLIAKIINPGKNLKCKIESVFLFINGFFKKTKTLFPNNFVLIISVEELSKFIKYYYINIKSINILAIVLTDKNFMDIKAINICKKNFSLKIPILITKDNIWKVLTKFKNINFERILYSKNNFHDIKKYIANCIDYKSLDLCLKSKNISIKNTLSPLSFRYNITQLARQYFKKIILPEGNEFRTIKAANFCAKNEIAYCILLGNYKEINDIAKDQNIILSKNIEIIDPNEIRNNYIERLMMLRKSKNINEIKAKKALMDNVVLGTMMLENNDVDGLVSGAVNTTANTIRPALQLIKTAKNISLVSSIFFMLLEDRVLVYGDCAINQNPNSEQLAEIAIQSANSAKYFGINPIIAMLSYSTGESSFGPDVDKIRKATSIVREKRPDLIIDGPLQYDTAIIENIAKTKAPHSKVAGNATVLIFPDLNSGNITYKAVQRSANLLSIGPILQGIRKPVNDLSRGALIEDIIYTIIITAIQASK